jgi:hypothetical protein
MDGFYSARTANTPALQWPSLSPPRTIFDESGMTLVPWEPVTPQKLVAQQSEVDAPT